MRISADFKDKGYDAYKALDTMNIKVYCDDVEIDYCITADDELGYCLVYSTDENQKLMTACGQPATHEVKGKVRIEVGE